jgi:hypothetical protein
MWVPWVGSRYSERRTLLLLQSCYDWKDDQSGEIIVPTQDHPRVLINHEVKNPLHNARTIIKLTRAVSGCERPSPEQAESGWNKYAYTNYIPVSDGFGPSARPRKDTWRQAKEEWPALLDQLKPKTIIVLGKQCWNKMPARTIRDDAANPFNYNTLNEGYRLANGDVAMCYVIKHPSRGPSFMEYSKFILAAENMRLNSTISEIT